MNQIILSGNLVGNTQNNDKLYTYYPEHDGKKAVLNFLVSVQRPFAKKDENGYYPSDLWNCKAFGPTADFINKYFAPGDAIEIQGYLAVDKGGDKGDGTKYPDRTYICVQNQGFVPSSRNKNQGAGASTQAKSVASSTVTTAKSNMFGAKVNKASQFTAMPWAKH